MGWALMRQLREPGSSAMVDSSWCLGLGLAEVFLYSISTTSNVARNRRSECRRVLCCVTRTGENRLAITCLNFERWLLLLHELTLTERAAAGDATAKLRQGRLLHTYLGNLREQGARLDWRRSLACNSKA